MQFLTGLFLAAVLGYGASWYLGYIEGSFDLLLFVVSVVTGLYWLAERFIFLPQRQQAVAKLDAETAQRRADLQKLGIDQGSAELAPAREKLLMQPWWLDWTAGMFPVIVTVFMLRSFLFEPFKIPSGSMIPTLLVGDLIVVNKYTYGLRLPILHTRLTEGTPPQRGDVMVFRYPPQPSQNYIKRVVGLPGDEVAYLNKTLTINGQAISKKPLPDFLQEDMSYRQQFEETLGEKTHRLQNKEGVPAAVATGQVADFFGREGCRYSIEGVVCKVPPGHYFMMGDNRDDSLDSRYWGFVPEGNIVGKAVAIWMNIPNLSRIGFFS